MKKKIIIAAALTAIAISASATVGFMSWCGKFTYTIDCGEVPEEYNEWEADKYYQELNVILCGSTGDYELIYY